MMEVLSGRATAVSFYPRGVTSKQASIHRQLFRKEGPLKGFIERAGSVFALRAQIQALLWRPNKELTAAVDRKAQQTMPPGVAAGGYIGMHIRATDNLDDIEGMFKIPRRRYLLPVFLARLQSMAEHFRREVRPGWEGPVPVYVATDNSRMLRQLEQWREGGDGRAAGLSFWYSSDDSKRAPQKDMLLKKRNRGDVMEHGKVQHLLLDTVTAVTLLAGADMLLGSQISNVFRLAAELHCAARDFAGCREVAERRDGNGTVWSMDLPWYQDP